MSVSPPVEPEAGQRVDGGEGEGANRLYSSQRLVSCLRTFAVRSVSRRFTLEVCFLHLYANVAFAVEGKLC